MFLTVALVPLSKITPFAFEMPFGDSVILTAAFFNSMRPFANGCAVVPRISACTMMLPSE